MMMYEDVLAFMMIDRFDRPQKYKHDRKDIYYLAGYEDIPYNLTRRYYYLLNEAHENPDEDW